VRVFSDPPKSVSELVTYVPSTLSSRSDDCCHVLSMFPLCFPYVSLMFPYDLFLDQGGQVGRGGGKGCSGGRFSNFFEFLVFFGIFWLFWQILAYFGFFGNFWFFWKNLDF
jgi:hypothetical protein